MTRPTGRLPLLIVALGVLLVAAGCADAPTGPSAVLVTPEAEAALRVASSLPTLPHLTERYLEEAPALDEEGRGALREARALWLEAESAEDPDAARALRAAAYVRAAPALARALDAGELATIHDRLDRWMRLAQGALAEVSTPEIAAALVDGRTLLAEARAAEATGDRTAAVASTLAAADRLLETTPGAVAMRLIRSAEQELERRRAGGAERDEAHELSLSRAERLLRGAREAWEQEDYARAIRRAYYAGQLLDPL